MALDMLKDDINNGTFPKLQTLILRSGATDEGDWLGRLRAVVERSGLREVCADKGIELEVKEWEFA